MDKNNIKMHGNSNNTMFDIYQLTAKSTFEYFCL